MTADDVPGVIALWKSSPGVSLTPSDNAAGVARVLERNPGTCLVAIADSGIVGAVLGGHDGRRGYLHHLAVAGGRRRRGIARRLVEECLDRLRSAGIEKVHVFLNRDNPQGRTFWAATGWVARADLEMMSRALPEDSGGGSAET